MPSRARTWFSTMPNIVQPKKRGRSRLAGSAARPSRQNTNPPSTTAAVTILQDAIARGVKPWCISSESLMNTGNRPKKTWTSNRAMKP